MVNLKRVRRMGNSIYKYADGNVFDGDWDDGYKHGKGIFNYANGDINDGGYKHDRKHGKGVMKYANGDEDVYDGD